MSRSDPYWRALRNQWAHHERRWLTCTPVETIGVSAVWQPKLAVQVKLKRPYGMKIQSGADICPVNVSKRHCPHGASTKSEQRARVSKPYHLATSPKSRQCVRSNALRGEQNTSKCVAASSVAPQRVILDFWQSRRSARSSTLIHFKSDGVCKTNDGCDMAQVFDVPPQKLLPTNLKRMASCLGVCTACTASSIAQAVTRPMWAGCALQYATDPPARDQLVIMS